MPETYDITEGETPPGQPRVTAAGGVEPHGVRHLILRYPPGGCQETGSFVGVVPL